MTREAEAAFSIEKPWQSHGVGSLLLERTLLAARNRGLKFLHMACLADNKRMQQLARKYGAELSFDFSSVVGEVTRSAADAALVPARIHCRQPWLRYRDVRRAGPDDRRMTEVGYRLSIIRYQVSGIRTFDP